MGNPAHPTVFRQWLVEKLSISRWSRFKGEDLGATAERLGVRPDVLEDALELRATRARAQGRSAGQVKPVVVDIALPQEIHLDMMAYCTMRDFTPAMMLRSLVFRLLSGPDQPSWLGDGWRYRGVNYPQPGHYALNKRGKKWPWNAMTKITPGAHRALVARAEWSGCTTSAMMRGLVIDLLEGRIASLRLVTLPAMFDDENRYWKTPV